ncbi:MAG TPA: L,D-transpeptidase [Thermoanaerobaculia bacterium]|nr:L,D-transpeptidase [Thermoanaerobaculia bacterium]
MKRIAVSAAVLACLLMCSKPAEMVKQTTTRVANKVSDAIDANVPWAGPDNGAAQARDQQRYDLQWRQLASFRAQQAAQQAAQLAAQLAAQQPGTTPAATGQQIRIVQGGKESFKGLDMNRINAAPMRVPITGHDSGPSVLRVQVYLDRDHFSVGAIDGGWGKNSSIAVWQWQRSHGIEPTGDVDEATFRSIADAAGNVEPLVKYQISADDLTGPFFTIPDSVYDQQNLSCMCYQTLREELAEKFHSAEDFLAQLNHGVTFSDLKAGDTIVVPNVRPAVTADPHDIAKIVISIAGDSFDAFDANQRLIFHAPTTVGSKYDPSPDETLHIVKIVPMPHFHYDPTLYAEVPDDKPDAHLNPGPNSPVGIVWMQLSKAHYGIHGTEDPESIGYVSSHGCVRLTNWDANEVSHRASEGTIVAFVDTKRSAGD